ncbi:TerC/Alx family metal homeostasis membrane protein [Pseudobacter ginsenosidimutans]|uniref:Tellurite resistance protein TerC n=1 Tax=Pseudobacter ginsenosidimutans TaxID=661488 RepID=A0A4Q7MU57_9BACT|nr:TerC/Alx family metal homeostasis membrane protein [Pseudobacter ginsenosidimutans]QEC40873.1 TerC/Alx family metal homeostasis membrane protein [Pseudobacter ginsenosidimutans]RZS72395.1 tellurite resistance protein TerC [Pseudobacter ginsenosidimutans]
MTTDQLTYLVFGIVIVVALAFDLGLLSKKNTHISLRKALFQTIFWVSLALGFFGFMWYEEGKVVALEYLSAYLMEWSLSIDNIFVFILIFNFFAVKDKFIARVLLIGILMAILFRVAFITVGIELVQRFGWILYIFGGILVYTGISLFTAKHDEDPNLEDNRVYKMIKRVLPITPLDGDGKWTMRIEGKKYYTSLTVVVIMLATTDIIFAVDSIPAVFAISQNHLVIYTSNIFAVLGLRSLFFLLKGASSKFSHLQQGIAFVLIFIGLKMLVTFFDIHVPIAISLLVIVMSVSLSIVYSISVARKNLEKEDKFLDEVGENTPKDLH